MFVKAVLFIALLQSPTLHETRPPGAPTLEDTKGWPTVMTNVETGPDQFLFTSDGPYRLFLSWLTDKGACPANATSCQIDVYIWMLIDGGTVQTSESMLFEYVIRGPAGEHQGFAYVRPNEAYDALVSDNWAIEDDIWVAQTGVDYKNEQKTVKLFYEHVQSAERQ